jgi:hypothetical protein
MGAHVRRRELAEAHGHRARHRTAHEEAVRERLPHIPNLVEILMDERPPHRVVVRSQGAGRPRRPSGPQGRECRVGGEAAGLDRVVDPLQRRHVDETGAVAG